MCWPSCTARRWPTCSSPVHPPPTNLQGRTLDSVRLPLYSALASYLTMCRWGAGVAAGPGIAVGLVICLPFPCPSRTLYL